MDHIRAVTFLVADGVTPSNKDQGYFARRLIRRAVRYADALGIHQNSCAYFAEAVIEYYANAYPELKTHQSRILAELAKEEEKFRQTLAKGLRIFQQAARVTADQQLAGKIAFDLHQSYGFPIELTQELATEQGLKVDLPGFERAFQEHQQLSRTSSAGKFKGGLLDTSEKSVHYHTATHLLHQALRSVLGDHVLQKGSNITSERLRFDFSHPTKMTPEEIKQVEDLVNEQITADLRVTRQEMSVTDAQALGALGLFEHKYGDKVSVYQMGDFSKEICGGPHVEHTGALGKFTITKEEAASAGVRRIKAMLEKS